MASEKSHALPGGMILITLGVLIYLSKTGVYPFGKTWPVLIIVVGLCSIFQRVKDFGGWFVTAAGTLFLINEFVGIEFSQYSKYMLPAMLVLLGIFVLFRRRKGK
ncbi:MAG: DUF5668 domain-containing protein [Smithella sp.]